MQSYGLLHYDEYLERDIIIASDSQSALQALQCYKITSIETWKCLETLNKFGSINNVRPISIPGHSGFLGMNLQEKAL